MPNLPNLPESGVEGQRSTPSVDEARAHRHRVVLSHHLHVELHANAFNAAAARLISVVLSSMWFFWFCVGLDLVELPAVVKAHDPVIWVGYLSQTVIQLLALPALGAYAKLNQATQDAQTTALGETAAATHTLVAAIHAINERQTAILKRLDPAPAAADPEG